MGIISLPRGILPPPDKMSGQFVSSLCYRHFNSSDSNAFNRGTTLVLLFSRRQRETGRGERTRVDDDILCGAMLSLDLLRLGHCPVLVASARAALNHLETDEAVDLILTDVLMPEMDGIELIQAIRRVGKTVPIVVMTCGGGLPNDYILRVARVLGADGVLNKPVSAGKMGTVISQLIPLASIDGGEDRRLPAPEPMIAA